MDPSKINMFLSWKADRIDAETERRKREDKFESLQQLGQQLQTVQRIWRSFIVEQARGEMMDPVGDGIGRAQLPADCLLGLEKVRVQVGQFLQTPVSIGVGLSLSDADQALLLCRFRGGDQLLIWDEDSMRPELAEAYEQARQEKMETLQKAWPKDEQENQANAAAHLVLQDALMERGAQETGVQRIAVPHKLATQKASQQRAQRAHDVNNANTPPGWRSVPHAGGPNVTIPPTKLGQVTGGWEDDPNDPVPSGEWAKADAKRVDRRTWQTIDSATHHQAFPIPNLIVDGRTFSFQHTYDNSTSTGGDPDHKTRIVEVGSVPDGDGNGLHAWYGTWDPQKMNWHGTVFGDQQPYSALHQHLTEYYRKNPLAKSLRKAAGDPEQTPANKPNAGGGFTGRSEPGAEAPPVKPVVEGSEHSQGEVARHELSARPTIEGTHAADLEEEFHQRAQEQEDSDKQEQQQQERYQSTRAKVVQLLQQVKEAAPQLEQLKQQAPGIYQVLLEMTQALIITGKAMVDSERQQQQPVQKSERRLKKAWEDPQTEASMAVFQDAAMEGRGDDLGARPIPMPPGVSPKRPTARPRSDQRGAWVPRPNAQREWDPDLVVPRPGWELIPASSRRTVLAERTNKWRTEPAQQLTNIQSMGGDVVHDRDYHGGFQGGWDRADLPGYQYNRSDLESHENRFWEQAMEEAQDKAFPIPPHPAQHSSGTPVNHDHRYNWIFDSSDQKWGISAQAGASADGYPGTHVAGYFDIDPQTGLTGKYVRQGGYNESNMRTHLDAFLTSLKGMHKKELEAALEKGKLPMPENQPKHIHQNWPLGWTKGDGKIKVQHPEDGKTTWVSVRAGQVLSNDGHAISSRNPSGR